MHIEEHGNTEARKRMASRRRKSSVVNGAKDHNVLSAAVDLADDRRGSIDRNGTELAQSTTLSLASSLLLPFTP